MQEFTRTQIEPLEESFMRESEEMQAMEEMAMKCDESEVGNYLAQYKRALENSLNCLLQKRSLVCAKVRELLEARCIVDKYFPKRTHSMVKTLQKIHLHMDTGEGNIYLVAGGNHLEEQPHADQKNADLLSLKELYDFIRDHKNIVILRPRVMR